MIYSYIISDYGTAPLKHTESFRLRFATPRQGGLGSLKDFARFERGVLTLRILFRFIVPLSDRLKPIFETFKILRINSLKDFGCFERGVLTLRRLFRFIAPPSDRLKPIF